MVGGETKIESAFSWADEVEKEEEEARIRTHERQRQILLALQGLEKSFSKRKGSIGENSTKIFTNPPIHGSCFSCLIRMQLFSHSILLFARSVAEKIYETPVEKPLKENNPAYSARAANKKHEISSGRSLQSKSEIRDPGFNRREVSGGFMTPQKQMGGVFVGPPPRYQTRNVLACLSEEAYHNSYRLDSEERKFREYTEFDFGVRRYSGVELRRPWMEALHCGRNLGKSVACEERRDADADYNRRKFMNHSSGCWPLRLMNPPSNGAAQQRRETLLIHEKRPPSVEDHARNGGVGRRLMNPPSNGAAPQRRETLLIHEKGHHMLMIMQEMVELAEG
ncbi:hypothetical protein CK203_017603 [Vitis vinifera]|uniref:Uncharacterized protein n=1 Tax=Vitis vinifera TaxID=29760 RepID=A0A438IY03_VITVI|nr:hypothetical protein CK203_017603 [Vitis vinifera]